ncbi:MAG: cytochrome c maturation protein CcmE [Candidatus Flexifilum sp.]|jgi:cytochrome c-type biogenesis protein CcmE|nr:MAG: hypothetical protein CUN53_05485 [Phototrophicales bacterium]
MTDISWSKPAVSAAAPRVVPGIDIKFLIGGALMIGAVIFLIASGTLTGARYFITVEELLANSSNYVGQTVRISGAVDGNTIVYDPSNLIIDFTIANIPADTTNLALSLHLAVNDPAAARLPVHVEGQVMPDLLQHEAQAILTGVLREDGVFYASELLLKCPSRYEENAPVQAEAAPGV